MQKMLRDDRNGQVYPYNPDLARHPNMHDHYESKELDAEKAAADAEAVATAKAKRKSPTRKKRAPAKKKATAKASAVAAAKEKPATPAEPPADDGDGLDLGDLDLSGLDDEGA